MEKICCKICGLKTFDTYILLNDPLNHDKEKFKLVKCKCNFIFLNPRPNENNIINYYNSDHYDPHNKNISSIWDSFYRYIQNILFRWKSKKINSIYKCPKILDIGGGLGAFAEYMSSLGCDTTMQDAFILIDNVKKNFNYVKTLDDVKENQVFDVITLWHSLEHIHKIEALFKHIDRLLKPNGQLFIAVPNLFAPERKFYGKNWAPYDTPRHLYHFTPDTLSEICKKYNFSVQRKYSLFQDSPYNILLSIPKFNIYQIIKAFLVLIYTILVTIIRGPNHSSSYLIICKKIY